MKRSLETGETEADGTPTKSARTETLTLELIGEGSMGMVYKTTYGEQNVAVKMCKPGTENFFIEEIKFHQQLADTPYVVKFLMSTDRPLRLFTELVTGGDLFDRISTISTGNRFTMQAYLTLFTKILTGIQHIHHANIIHRDIKPENILLDQTGNPKITDFGLACDLPPNAQCVSTGASVGSPMYADPESMLEPHNFRFQSDIYSLGIVMISAATGNAPFMNNVDIEKIRTRQLQPHIDRRINNELKPIMTACTQFFAQRRPNSVDLMKQLQQVDTSKPPLTIKPTH